MDPQGKFSFAVFSLSNKKRYKVSVKRTDAHKLSVLKIKKNLCKVTNIPVDEQLIFWNNTELMDDTVGADFDLNEDTVLQLATISPTNSPTTEDTVEEVEEDEFIEDREQPAPEYEHPALPEETYIVSHSSFNPSKTSNYSSSDLLSNPPTANKARVITLTPSLKIVPGANISTVENSNLQNEGQEQQSFEEVSSTLILQKDEVKSDDDRGKNSSESSDPELNASSGGSVDRPESPVKMSAREYASNVPSPKVLYSNELKLSNSQSSLPLSPSTRSSTLLSESTRVESPKGNSSTSPNNGREMKYPMNGFKRDKSTIDLNELLRQMTEEKTMLMRMWANEKKDILRRANEDREQLMIENSRLRKEISSSYSSYNIDDIESDLNQMRRRCQTMEKHNIELQSKLFHSQQQVEMMKDEHSRDKEQWVRESQTSQEDIKRLSLQIRSEQDRVNDIKQNQHIRDQLHKERMQWEEEKQIIFKNWKEEVEILTAVAKNERDSWYSEKSQLVKQMESEKVVSIRERESQIVSLNDNLDDAYNEIDVLRQENGDLNTHIKNITSEYEHNKLMAQSADVAIRELKYQIRDLMNGSDSSELLSNAIQQRVMEEKKSEKIALENAVLRERFHEEMRKRKYLHNILEDMKGNIRVIIRMRPILKGERRGDTQVGRVELKDEQTVTVYTNTQGTKSFEFFRTLNETASQDEVFEEIKPLIQSAIDGYNVCIMAYGQTGSGKTFTIYGDEAGVHRGVLPRAANYLFDLLRKYSFNPGQDIYAANGHRTNTFSVKCSMIELYLDSIFDLLDEGSGKKFDMKQHQSGFMYVPGVSEYNVVSPEALLETLSDGNKKRQVHRTEMNDRSSRSHTIFTIYLTTSFNKGDEIVTTSSKILFVDLAGSERISKSHSEGDRLKEATHINKSLSSLGDVIAALSAEKKTFVPYRNSKLTLLLQDSIGGNSKTIMFANISPSSTSISETVSTLNFSSRVKIIQNQNVRNATTVQSSALML